MTPRPPGPRVMRRPARWVAPATLAAWLIAAPELRAEPAPDEPDREDAVASPAGSTSPVSMAEALGIDLATLVVPPPQPPALRTPQDDIRRLLRPEHSLLEARERLDLHIRERSARLARLEQTEALLTTDLERATADFNAMTAARDAEREVVRTRLRVMDRLQSRSPRRWRLGTSGAMRDLDRVARVERMEAEERLLEADRQRVTRYQTQLAAWRSARADLARRRANLLHTRETIVHLSQELAWDREEKSALEEAVRTKPEFFAVHAREMEALDPLLADKVRDVVDPEHQRLYIEETRGSLAMPIRNPDVVARFGVRTHAQLETRTVHRGIVLVPARPADTTEIRAIYWGYIAYTGWIRGLGRIVIVDHTQGYASIYAHIDQVTVEIGEKVRTGQPIATLGDTGSFWGPRLYLELRKDGRAINPLPWLR